MVINIPPSSDPSVIEDAEDTGWTEDRKLMSQRRREAPGPHLVARMGTSSGAAFLYWLDPKVISTTQIAPCGNGKSAASAECNTLKGDLNVWNCGLVQAQWEIGSAGRRQGPV
jgi:hypothetical protein